MPLEKPAKPPSLRQALADFGGLYAANALVAFIFAASGPVAFPEIVGAPFRGLVLGVAVSWLLERKDFAERAE